MPTLRPNTVDSHIISFHWPLISLTLFNAPPNSPADFPRSTAIGSEDIPYFHIYFLLSIFRFKLLESRYIPTMLVQFRVPPGIPIAWVPPALTG
jgi:hypothetical protein